MLFRCVDGHSRCRPCPWEPGMVLGPVYGSSPWNPDSDPVRWGPVRHLSLSGEETGSVRSQSWEVAETGPSTGSLNPGPGHPGALPGCFLAVSQ